MVFGIYFVMKLKTIAIIFFYLIRCTQQIKFLVYFYLKTNLCVLLLTNQINNFNLTAKGQRLILKDFRIVLCKVQNTKCDTPYLEVDCTSRPDFEIIPPREFTSRALRNQHKAQIEVCVMLYRVGLIFKFLKDKLLVFILWPKIQDWNRFGPVVWILTPHNTKGISTKT